MKFSKDILLQAIGVITASYFLSGCLPPTADSLTNSNEIRMSEPFEGVGASVGSKILFTGNDYTTGLVEIIDTNNNGQREFANLSVPRRGPAAITYDQKIYFVGGGFLNSGFSSTIDIYDSVQNTWSTQNLQIPRLVYGVTVVDGKLIVPGGYNDVQVSTALSDMEVIDLNTWQKTHVTLSSGRGDYAVAAVGSKAYIIGGRSCWRVPLNCVLDTIDIYDAASGSISTTSMPRKRSGHVAVAYGTKIYIAGGGDDYSFYNTVDILETTDNSWTTATLDQPPGQSVTAGAVGNYIFFAGGNNSVTAFIDTVSVLNVSTGVWSKLSMSKGRYNMALAVTNGKAYLAGGAQPEGGDSDLIEVLDSSTELLSIYQKNSN